MNEQPGRCPDRACGIVRRDRRSHIHSGDLRQREQFLEQIFLASGAGGFLVSTRNPEGNPEYETRTCGAKRACQHGENADRKYD
jgi:hypothetical protein